ncbi:MAG: hypothetical protein HOP30_07410 [Cyclobacteriaceae bacterium]|nr:hypothetical protein [Cyclobacteriaceae bacterium]
MKKAVIIGLLFIALCSLVILRLAVLPEPVKVSYGLGGLSKRYLALQIDSMETDTSTVDHAILFSGLLTLDEHLDKSETQRLLSILLNTSNYEWKEAETNGRVKKIIYYNQNNKVVGQTHLNTDGHVFTYPWTLEQNKRGLLNKSGLEKVMKVID